MKRVLSLLALLLAWPVVRADEPKQLLNVAYGTHPRQVLDFYPAKSEKPTPVVFYIHGGGGRAERRQEDQSQTVPGQGHFRRGDQLPVRPERRGREDRAAGEGAAGGRRPGFAVRPLEGRRVEPRQETHRCHGRLGRRLLVAV